MTKREFQATEGLLEDVMTKQAGSLEKAALEAVMNSVDAGADNIEITFQTDFISIEDDGEGMGEDEISEYFEKFGLKDTDQEEKDFGKFRMGRGQIFSFGKNVWHTKNNYLVVDLNNDETEVTVDGETHTLDSSGLSYNVLNTEEEQQGCHIYVELYNQVEEVDQKEKDIEHLIRYISWVHDVNVTLNGEKVDYEPEVHTETSLAWYVLDPDSFSTTTHIYNQGAHVMDESFTRTSGEIITKKDLDVNFARNAVLDSEDGLDKMKEEYTTAAVEQLLNKDDITVGQKKWLLETAGKKPEFKSLISTKPLIPTITGDEVPLSDLIGAKVAFAPVGDKRAERAAEQSDAVVIKQSFEDCLHAFKTESDVKSYEQLVEGSMKFEMSEYYYGDLNKRRKENFDRVEWALRKAGFTDEIRVGYSQYSDCWKDDDGTLWIDKKFLKSSKQSFVVEKMDTVFEVAAHNGDSRQGIEHDYKFKDNYWRLTENLGSYKQMLLNSNPHQ